MAMRVKTTCGQPYRLKLIWKMLSFRRLSKRSWTLGPTRWASLSLPWPATTRQGVHSSLRFAKYGKTSSLKLTKWIHPPQERFLLRKSNDSTDPIVYQWWVPLTYTSDYQTNKRDWLSVDQVSKTLPNLGAAANQWVIFNIDQQSQYKLVSAILPSFNATFC